MEPLGLTIIVVSIALAIGSAYATIKPWCKLWQVLAFAIAAVITAFIGTALLPMHKVQAAEFYAGAGVGGGSTQAPPQADVSEWVSGYVRDSSAVAQAFVGVRYGYLGLEAGGLRLPTYKSRAVVSDYPAYRMASLGQEVSFPQSADITQTIDSKAAYARLNVYGPEVWHLTPYGFYGVARVLSQNVEQGSYNDGAVPAYHSVNLRKDVPYYGAGIEARFNQNWGGRVEYGVLPGATDSWWTGRRDIKMVNISVVYNF